jgi:hypothetical protein
VLLELKRRDLSGFNMKTEAIKTDYEQWVEFLNKRKLDFEEHTLNMVSGYRKLLQVYDRLGEPDFQLEFESTGRILCN